MPAFVPVWDEQGGSRIPTIHCLAVRAAGVPCLPAPFTPTRGRRVGRGSSLLPSSMLRDLGPALNPFAAFLLMQGLDTLSLRAARHCATARMRRRWRRAALSQNPHVRALTTLRAGAFGGVLNFGVKPLTLLQGDSAHASKVVDLLKLASNLANLGDANTLVIHPASTTHQQLSSARVGYVSVGIEDIIDIVADFENALRIAFDGAS
ncbi:Cys/Met metabolism PLP-dependent enzyme-domain-containing protein [Mycena rosella]|uniref:Cys/Met metabolism PLP-dependent enzyme-domain-containing protein n=1 Tax=Mycena rosella TaxID=1033263 RepID=A0AAD7DRZ9_MYCRO|nr:Cys/Met metabolism PLP-dependent enzyme-domain-containing protein [Mycena rosella]